MTSLTSDSLIYNYIICSFFCIFVSHNLPFIPKYSSAVAKVNHGLNIKDEYKMNNTMSKKKVYNMLVNNLKFQLTFSSKNFSFVFFYKEKVLS